MREAILVRTWDDLKQFGINRLTGEACSYGMRQLCDLNEDGAGLIMSYLGVVMLQDNWNSTVDDKPAVASAMLHRESLLQIAEYALTCWGAIAFVYMHNSIIGIFNEDYLNRYRHVIDDGTLKGEIRTVYRTGAPQVNGRNVHQMSGRSA